MENICYGCGAVLQDHDDKLVGYSPKIDNEHLLCKRCFRMKNYHDLKPTSLNDHDYISLLDTIADKKCLVVYIIDLFDLNGSIIQGLHRHIGDHPILVLANKRDLLPKIINDSKLKNYIQHFLKINDIHPIDVLITSGIKNYSLDSVYDLINLYRKKNDVYIVGNTNVGKSTLINALLKNYSDFNQFITVSEFPGTTLGMIKIQMDEFSYIYDTPGIINNHSYLSHLSVDDLNKVILKTEVKPISYQLNSSQTLYVSGLGRIDFISGDSTGFITYFSKNLDVHRTKLSNADHLFDNEILKMKLVKLKDMQVDEYHLDNNKYDIVFTGLGFISVVGKNTNIKVYHPKNTDVVLRKSMF